MENLQSLSIRELEALLLEELNNIKAAQERFNKKKIELALNFKRIDPKVEKISTLIDLAHTNEMVKANLIRRIMAARAQVKRIDALTLKMGSIPFSEFERTFSAELTDSRVIQILRNLHATDDEINDMLQILRGDEDYEEIRDAYNTYQVDKIIEEGGEVIPEEEAIDFFANRQQ